MEFISILRDISIVIASLTAIYGIGSWRREYRGKKQAELAEDVLSLFYEAQDAIRHIRSPFGYGGEGSSRKANEHESPEEKAVLDNAYVVFERHNSYKELFSKIHALRYRFMAQFGVEAAQPFDDLRKIVNEIFVSARRLSRLWGKQYRSFHTKEQEKKYHESIQKHEAIFWKGLPEEDPISPRLNQCIADIETTCKDILSVKGTLVSTIGCPVSKLFNKLFDKK